MELSEKINNSLLAQGASLVGFGDLSEVPSEQRSHMRYGVSIAVALTPRVVRGIKNGPTREYFQEYCAVNKRLNELAELTGGMLKESGYAAVMKTTTETPVDGESLASLLPHKTVATRAGLGWIGKCALLVTKKYGSAVRITSVLTDAPLPAATPVNQSKCGDECFLCKLFCPGNAPLGKKWQVGMERADFFDAFACRKAAKGKAAAIEVDYALCGKCIEVCPWTQKYIRVRKTK